MVSLEHLRMPWLKNAHERKGRCHTIYSEKNDDIEAADNQPQHRPSLGHGDSQGGGGGKMVSPVRRREAVEMVEDRLEVSQRRAYSTLGQHRSTQRYRPPPPLVGRAALGSHPALGPCPAALGLPHGGRQAAGRRLGGELQTGAPALEAGRTARSHQGAKRRSLGSRRHGASRLKAERRNHVWSYDFIFDQTSDGRRLKWLPLVDELTKESLALEVDRRLESGDVGAALDKAVAQYGAPEFIWPWQKRSATAEQSSQKSAWVPEGKASNSPESRRGSAHGSHRENYTTQPLEKWHGSNCSRQDGSAEPSAPIV
jgi:hypothetical protein